jgi:hypothetical protein
MILFNSLSHAHLTSSDRAALEHDGLRLIPVDGKTSRHGQEDLHYCDGNRQPDGHPLADFNFREHPGDYRTEYSPTILNRFNRIAYSLREQHQWMAQQVHYLTSPPFILALTRLIRQQYKHHRVVIADLAGGGCHQRWSAIAQALPDKKFEVHVFDLARYSHEQTAANLVIRSHLCNLAFDTPAIGSPFHLACCFYGADSFWGPNDITYYRHENQWWQRSWRLRVPAWYDRRDLLVHEIAADHAAPPITTMLPRDLAVLGIEWRWTVSSPPLDICALHDLPAYVTPPRTLAALYSKVLPLLADNGLFLCGDVSLGEVEPDAGLYSWGFARYQFVSLWSLPALMPSLCYQSLGAFLHNWKAASLPTREELAMAPLLADLWGRSANHEGIVLGRRPSNEIASRPQDHSS